ncbi:hypothetical protein B7P43_G09065 [Cryptotermes secundus]|uniref:Uncharacterized protein n=1 Tax=Cryptotermes secundus TaxID=105785 RepID=A0A2J7PLG0_9NEOP|nr:hypothetical protein B7P43_G09065 [Cryptotermes secundus]
MEFLPLHLSSRTPMLPPLLHRSLMEPLLLLVEEPVPGPVSALIALEAASLDLAAVLHHRYMGLLPIPQPFSPHLLRTALSPQLTEPLLSKAILRRSMMHPRMTSQNQQCMNSRTRWRMQPLAVTSVTGRSVREALRGELTRCSCLMAGSRSSSTKPIRTATTPRSDMSKLDTLLQGELVDHTKYKSNHRVKICRSMQFANLCFLYILPKQLYAAYHIQILHMHNTPQRRYC